MSSIISIHGREILDSRGQPTLEVEVKTADGGFGRAAVPSGASTGAHEAYELRDGDSARYHGKGVLTAVHNVNEIIAPELEGYEVLDQVLIDELMITLDGTFQKKKLGANAILGVSLAVAHAGADETGLPLFRSVGGSQAVQLPVPLMNVINGGAHADSGLDVQEFMIVPHGFDNFPEALRAGSEVFQALKKILKEKHLSTSVGDEGGFAPHLKSNGEALELLMRAIESVGYKPGDQISLALDVASTEFFKDGMYLWEKKQISAEELIEIYSQWTQKFPLISIEDGCAEDDWTGWTKLTSALGSKAQLVGDDLFVTNTARLKQGFEKKAANALLVKVNQIGTLTETSKAVRLAQRNRFNTVMSHRSGETEDATISDLSVALDCSQIKTGSLCRSDRTAKYNQLLRINEFLGEQASYWGSRAFKSF